GSHGEAAAFHCPRETLQKWLVILHNQERAIGVARQFGDGVHVEISLCPASNIWRHNAALPRPHKVDPQHLKAAASVKMRFPPTFRSFRSAAAATRSGPPRHGRERPGW